MPEVSPLRGRLAGVSVPPFVLITGPEGLLAERAHETWRVPRVTSYVAVGLVGGFIPAWRAARLKIVDGLRAA